MATMLLLLLIVPSVCYAQDTLSLRKSPPGAAAPDTMVMFICQNSGANVSWSVNGENLEVSNSEFNLVYEHTTNLIISNLTTLAKISANNTRISCFVRGSPSAGSQSASVIVAAPPLPPQIRLSFSNGTHIQVQWGPPYTPPGFNLTSYTLDVVNKTTATTEKVIVNQDLLRTQTYTLVSSSVPLSCHNITFSVIAANAVGDSATSNMVSSGFPIFPDTTHVVLHVDLNTTSGSPFLIVNFQAPLVCSFQEPALYTVGIFDSAGELITSTGPKSVSAAFIMDTVDLELEVGQSYSAELTIQHSQVPGEAFVTFLGIDFFQITTHSGAANRNWSREQAATVAVLSVIFAFLTLAR